MKLSDCRFTNGAGRAIAGGIWRGGRGHRDCRLVERGDQCAFKAIELLKTTRRFSDPADSRDRRSPLPLVGRLPPRKPRRYALPVLRSFNLPTRPIRLLRDFCAHRITFDPLLMSIRLLMVLAQSAPEGGMRLGYATGRSIVVELICIAVLLVLLGSTAGLLRLIDRL